MSMRIFIGSASESLNDARRVAEWIELLRRGCRVSVWNKPGLFIATRGVWDQLYDVAGESDAAVIIFGENDLAWIRGKLIPAPRDNALLEFGLFAGRLGVGRVAFCVQGSPAIATDLSGLVYIDISATRENLAQRELEAWLATITGRTETPPRGVKGAKKSSRATPSNKSRPITASRTTLAPDIGLEAEAASQQLKRYPDGDGGADPLTAALAAGVSSKLVQQRDFFPELLTRNTELVIERNGDGRCSVRETIRCPERVVHAVPFVLAGDHPIADASELEIQIRTHTQNHEVRWRVVEDQTRSRSLLVLFEPPLPQGETVTYEVSWTWPKMWLRLIAGQRDAWRQPVRSSTPVQHSSIGLTVHPRIPRLRLNNGGNGGGALADNDKSLDPQGYRKYRWTMENTPPGGDVVLWLYPMGKRS